MNDKKSRPLEHPRPKSTKDAPIVPEVQRNIGSGEEPEPEEDGELSDIFFDNPKLRERPISSVYPVIDTDLARDNIENDLSDADLQDL